MEKANPSRYSQLAKKELSRTLTFQLSTEGTPRAMLPVASLLWEPTKKCPGERRRGALHGALLSWRLRFPPQLQKILISPSSAGSVTTQIMPRAARQAIANPVSRGQHGAPSSSSRGHGWDVHHDGRGPQPLSSRSCPRPIGPEK